MIRAERHVEAEMDVCGGITVFLSLILTCICALMGGLFESARAAGSGWYMQMALNSSLDSLMSCYHREIWDKYRIFVLECADKERLAAEMEPQMETYLAAAPFIRSAAARHRSKRWMRSPAIMGISLRRKLPII